MATASKNDRGLVNLSIEISPELYDRLENIAINTGSNLGETLAKAIVLMDIAVQEKKRSASGSIWVSPAPASGSGSAAFGVSVSGEGMVQGADAEAEQLGTEIKGI